MTLDETIENAAKAIWELDKRGWHQGIEWKRLAADIQEAYRDGARTALIEAFRYAAEWSKEQKLRSIALEKNNPDNKQYQNWLSGKAAEAIAAQDHFLSLISQLKGEKP